MPSPYDDGWLDMRDVELQLNDPRTKSLVFDERKPIRNPSTGRFDGSYTQTFASTDGRMVGHCISIPYRRAPKQ